MIIKRLTLTNFGLYGGEHTFDLTPQPEAGFNRPIILFKGQNGAGKTTLLEAIRLCLHGALALGSRVSRAEYEAHLARRIHVPLEPDRKPTSARLSLELEYTSLGRKHLYAIERSWRVVTSTPENAAKVKETLTVLENGQTPPELTSPGQLEIFLRDLIPPNITEIFFFDGEKLQMLAGDETGQHLLADTMKVLLGLHLVEQLQKDLDVYLARQELSSGLRALQAQLETLNQEKDSLERKRADLQARQRENQQAIETIRQKIAHQDQKIASKGSWFAEQLTNLTAAQQRLTLEIEQERKVAQELANGLLPFAISPKLLEAVANRLHRERVYEQAVSGQQIITETYGYVETQFRQAGYLSELDINIDAETLAKLLSAVKATMLSAIESMPLTPADIVLDLSEKDRQTLLHWLEQALADIPQQFCRVINHLNTLEAQLEQTNQGLALVPSQKTLQPLVVTLQQYHQELGALQKVEKDLHTQLEQVSFRLQQTTWQLRNIHQQIADHEQHDRRIQLASKTHLVLADYAYTLNKEKINRLERVITQRFNELNRKVGLIEAIQINPDTFKLTLIRQGRSFERSQLSAGENQLLAVAIMWALREVANLPMPVILDTPLGRLDQEHRRKLIDEYFPRASHQVILLATDAEIDGVMEERLAPVISYCYDLTPARVEPARLESYSVNGHMRQIALLNEEGPAYEIQ